MSDFIEQLLIAATIDSFFRLKRGRTAWQLAHPLLASRYDRVLSNLGKGAVEAFDAADAHYGGAW